MALGDARIQITPNATNPVWQNPAKSTPNTHTWVATLQKWINPAPDGFYEPAVGETVTITLTTQFGAIPKPPGPFSGVTNASGQVIFTFSSLAPGQTIGHASATLDVLGVPVTVSTNGVAPNSSDATVTWVDARIRFLVLAATNARGAGHTWTAFVEKNAGVGAGWVIAPDIPAPGINQSRSTVTVTLTNRDGAVASPAGPFTGPADAGGQFTTPSFTSATTGQVVARASVTVTNILGVNVSATTGNQERWGGFSDYGNLPPDAVKTFV